MIKIEKYSIGVGDRFAHQAKAQLLAVDPLVFADGRLAWVPGVAVDADAAASPGGPAMHIALVDPVVGDPDVTGRGI